jgi:hypothetical protein
VKLPFTHDQFLDVFEAYNRALWPVLLVLWIGTVGALWRWYRDGASSSKILALILALHWAWSGVVYHWMFFRRINPVAALFGLGFLVEAVLLLWRGAIRKTLTFRRPHNGWGWLGVALIVYALFYPMVGWLFGFRFPRLPSFAVPCPTGLLTAGLLLLAPRREARLLGVIPILWAAIGGSAAFLLGISADFALPVAGATLLGYLVTRNRAENTPPS